MQKDMHYYGVYTLARSAGLNTEAARIIATASQYVDDSVSKEIKDHKDGGKIISVASAHHFYDLANSDKNDQRYIWVPFHFLPGGKGKSLSEKLVCRKNSAIAKEMVANHISKANDTYALQLLGVAAHVYADTFAHYGFSGVSSRRNRVKGKSLRIENPNALIQQFLGKRAAKFFKKYGKQGGLKDNFRSEEVRFWYKLIRLYRKLASSGAELASGALGHGAVAIYPDQPYLKWSFEYEYPEMVSKKDSVRDNPKTYIEACKVLYEMFVEFGKSRPDLLDGKGKPFNIIKPVIKEILSAEAAWDWRVLCWTAAVVDGKFYDSNGESIPMYSHEDWDAQRDSMATLKNSKDAKNLEVYGFYQAVSYHQHYVLRELLPKHGIIVV